MNTRLLKSIVAGLFLAVAIINLGWSAMALFLACVIATDTNK